MRFVVEGGEVKVYARVEELAVDIDPPVTGNGEVHVISLPLHEGANNEEIVEPMANGIASILEAGWGDPAAKVRDVVVITEHSSGEYSWVSLQRNGACEGSNILDATLDLGVHFIINHEYREQQLGDREYRALSPEEYFTLEVCQVLLESLSVPLLFADSDMLVEEEREDDPPPKSWREYEEEAGYSTQKLLERIAVGEEVARTESEWEYYSDWLWAYDESLRTQWREAVLSQLGFQLAVLRAALEDLEAERQRIGDAISRFNEQRQGLVGEDDE